MTPTEAVAWLRVTPVTGTVAGVTVTVQAAALPPSAVVAVMTAVPGATPETLPLWSTPATAGLEEVQRTVLLVASAGRTVAVSWREALTATEAVAWSRVTPVTGMAAWLTVTAQEAVLPPSLLVAVMTAVPGALAVTVPVASTEATFAALELQVTPWLVASVGVKTGSRVSF